MAALDDIQVKYLDVDTDEEVVRARISALFWGWYEENMDQVVTKVDLFIFKKTVKVRDIRPIFEMLFGPQFITIT